jgi:hypothetical protein
LLPFEKYPKTRLKLIAKQSAHPNPLMGPLITPPPIRRLRGKWIFDELNWNGVAGLLLDTEDTPSTLA